MDQKLLPFVWQNAKVDTIKTLCLTFMTFPVIYISLEIPKIIVNRALGAGKEPVDFPVTYYGVSLDQMQYLLILCLLFITMIVANNGLKFFLNVQIGRTSERMLRRLRYRLYENVMRFRIRRFQHMKQGEIVQSIMGEVEPLGGFFGEVISTPVWQGGMLIVYMTFIILQDFWLGLAAIALYPVQGFIIPKLQKRVVILNKERVANVRKIADNVGESVGAIEEIHANDTARWHLAQVADRLYESYRIRLEIFNRKYLIKGLNNFMIALTPFAFYLFGGIQVINGNLEIGSLVAVLAAYKDVAGPWKELLNYFQRWSDLNSRYELVVDNFSGDDVYERDRIYGADGEDGRPLTGDVEIRNASFGPGSSGLVQASCKAPSGGFTAVIGGEDGGREVLMKMMAGLVQPESGRAQIGGAEISEITMPVAGRSLAYVANDSVFFAGTMRENLTYSLRKSPAMLTDDEREDAVERLKEAEQTGNFAASPFGDWTDYAAAGVDGAADLNRRMVELAGKVGLAEELYHMGLQTRIDPARHPEIAAQILEARDQLREAAAKDETVADIVEFWDPERFNQNASLLENILFGMPTEAKASISDYADDPKALAVLEEAGAIKPLLKIGLSIAEQLIELLGSVDEDSSLLDSFTDFAKKDILASAEIVEAAKMKADYEPKEEARRILLGFALAFVPVRDRLDAMDDAEEAEILAARKKALEITRDSPDFVAFGEERYSPALSLSENLLDGKRRYDRRSAWRRFDGFLEEAIDKRGLRPGVTEVGLSAPLTAGGGGLSAASKRRAALLRALLKRPAYLIVDGIAGGGGEDEDRLRAAIREEMQGRTVVIAVNDVDAARLSDHLIRIGPDGTTKEGAPSSMLESV